MSAEKNIASGFRRCVIAEPGFSLIEADKAAVEAVVTGWFARSASYIRLAALGVHDFLTSHLIGKPADLTWENKKLGAYFKEVKAKYGSDRELAKKVVHGSNYGLTSYGMAKRYPEMFTVASATTLQDLYFKICPELKAWQDATRLLAHKQGYLSNPWGYKHWFWDVYGWNGRTGRYQRGKDHDRVVAYPGQSTSAGLLYEDALLVMEDRKFPTLYKGKSPVRALIHDSILAEIPDSSIGYCSAMFQRVMTREIPQLPCPTEWGLGPLLSIGVSVKVGKNWAPWSEKNPQGMKEVVEELGTASDTAVLEGEPEDEE